MPDSAPEPDDLLADGLKLDTKSRILQAAVKVFAARGYDAATIREITRLVGVSHGLIKYHFENKEALWRAAVRFTFERAVRAMTLGEDEVKRLSPRQQAELEVRKSIQYYGQHPEHIRLLMQEIMAGGERLRWIVENFTGPMVNDAIARTREHMASGAFRDMDPMLHYYAVSGASRMMFVMAPEVQLIFGMDPTAPETIEAHIQAITRIAMQDQD